jgi:uncharacterized protein YegL
MIFKAPALRAKGAGEGGGARSAGASRGPARGGEVVRFHFIFCLDESTSMSGSWAALLNAYQTFINKRRKDQGMGDVVSTITFSSEYRNQGMLVPIGSVNLHLKFHAGGTNFDQALSGAREALAREALGAGREFF